MGAGRRPSAVAADLADGLADAVSDPAELCRLLGLPPEVAAAARRRRRELPPAGPADLSGSHRPGQPSGPAAPAGPPTGGGTEPTPRFQADPLGEALAACGPGLLRKYPGRLLIVTTGGCAVHCRFCFRRHFPYPNLLPAATPTGSPPLQTGGRRQFDRRNRPERRRSAHPARRAALPILPSNWPKSPTSGGCGFTAGCRLWSPSGCRASCWTGYAAPGLRPSWWSM